MILWILRLWCWCSHKNKRKNNAMAPTYIAINVLQIDLKLRNHFSASVGLKAAVKHGISIAKFMNELISMLNIIRRRRWKQRQRWHSNRSRHSMVSWGSTCEAQIGISLLKILTSSTWVSFMQIYLFTSAHLYNYRHTFYKIIHKTVNE